MILKKLFFALLCCLAILLTSCEKNHKKIAKKLLVSADEKNCSALIDSISNELDKDDYYTWNGTKCELKVTGELEELIKKLIDFHEKNHSFVTKKGDFDEEKWDDWMYFKNHSGEVEKPAELFTNCFLCIEKDDSDNKSEFDSKLVDSSLENIIYSSYFGESVKEKEDSLTKIKKEQLKLQWMGNCDILMSDYIWHSVKTINDIFKGLPKSVTITRKVNGKTLIVYAKASADGDEVMSIAAAFPCTKLGNGGTCYVSEVEVTMLGQSASAKCYGGVYSDPHGAGKCLGLLSSALGAFNKTN
ncbi:MAG: hypothetical protein IK015_08055 [Treponema sp.]|nr:hypothetical protein [Treponema sp.]